MCQRWLFASRQPRIYCYNTIMLAIPTKQLNSIFERIIRDKNGILVRIRFTVVEINGKFQPVIISAEALVKNKEEESFQTEEQRHYDMLRYDHCVDAEDSRKYPYLSDKVRESEEENLKWLHRD